MIRVQVTERLIFEANEFIENIKNAQFENSHDYKEEHKIIGALGEIALIDYCWNNDLLAFKNEGRSSDVRLYSGHTIEVKTQKVTANPETHYMVNMAAHQKSTEKSDFIFFTHLQYVAGRPEAIWLLGGCSWDKFWRLSEKHLQGEPMMRHYANGDEVPSGRYFATNVQTLRISQLAPPSAALKHFKSLQEKESTQ
jgi:hypothetical protein